MELRTVALLADLQRAAMPACRGRKFPLWVWLGLKNGWRHWHGGCIVVVKGHWENWLCIILFPIFGAVLLRCCGPNLDRQTQGHWDNWLCIILFAIFGAVLLRWCRPNVDRQTQHSAANCHCAEEKDGQGKQGHWAQTLQKKSRQIIYSTVYTVHYSTVITRTPKMHPIFLLQS